ncbi:MAG: GNAT family N-acetyltransferase [Phaeodactylibacter sp.]|nr:GNAT family N-acetyltransferase [Phaeodactylibacter sp.]MCB9273660.1 GNAT family N-acetyltransferase [Lewinellaceae bacterium]
MEKYRNIRTIAFDADDTLWVNEPIFQQTQERLKALLAPYVAPEIFDEQLYATERNNLHLFGYGVKGFTLSMIETAIQLTNGKMDGRTAQQIIGMGKEMLEHPIELLDGVEETIEALAPYYELMIITKGDLFDQESKAARSGLAGRFRHIEVVSEKDEDTYRRVFQRHGISLSQVLMVGNSLKSDILPICRLGGKAVHVPYHISWVHEQVASHQMEGHDYDEIGNLRQLIRLLNPGQRPALEDVEVLIAGDGFHLRRFSHTDIPHVARYANNANIATRLQDRFPHPYTAQDARAFIDYTLNADMESIFAIDVEGQAVGSIGLIFQPDVYSISAELGYWLGEEFWGRGIATSAVGKMVQHAFSDLKLHRVFARVFSNNGASRRVLEKAGFRLEGNAREAVMKNGKVLNLLTFGILAGE